MLYDESRYVYRGKFAESRFEKNCLAEYAEVFKTVCVDAAYYKFPDEKYLDRPRLPGAGGFSIRLQGDGRSHHQEISQSAALRRPRRQAQRTFPQCRTVRQCVPETVRGRSAKTLACSCLNSPAFTPATTNMAATSSPTWTNFSARSPKAGPMRWKCATSIGCSRITSQCLARHGVTHVFNSWEAMPPVSEQMAMPGSQTNPALTAARFLLKPGRKYEEAVKTFEPYDRVKEPNDEARAAGAKLDRRWQDGGKKADLHLRQQPAGRQRPRNHRRNGRRCWLNGEGASTPPFCAREGSPPPTPCRRLGLPRRGDEACITALALTKCYSFPS